MGHKKCEEAEKIADASGNVRKRVMRKMRERERRGAGVSRGFLRIANWP